MVVVQAVTETVAVVISVLMMMMTVQMCSQGMQVLSCNILII